MKFLPKIEEEEQSLSPKQDEEVIDIVCKENTTVGEGNNSVPEIRLETEYGDPCANECYFESKSVSLTSTTEDNSSESISSSPDDSNTLEKAKLSNDSLSREEDSPHQIIAETSDVISDNLISETKSEKHTGEISNESSKGLLQEIIESENTPLNEIVFNKQETSQTSLKDSRSTRKNGNTKDANNSIKGNTEPRASSSKGESNGSNTKNHRKIKSANSNSSSNRDSPSISWSPYPTIPDFVVKGLTSNDPGNQNRALRGDSSSNEKVNGILDKMVRENSSLKSDMNSLDLVRKYYSLFLDFSSKREPTQDEDDFHPGGNNGRLEEVIKLHHLQQLMREFSQHRPKDILVQAGSGYFPPKVLKRTPGCMNLEEFKATISKVLATDEYDDYLEKLFMKLDTSCDGYVDWNEFCTYMLLLYRENDYLRTKREIPFVSEPKIRHIVHNRQEQTSRVLAVHGPTRYVTISKEGAMSVWQPNMVLEKHYSVADQDDDPGIQKRRFKMWVTDAVYMKNCQKLAIGSTSRDVRFYDVSSSQYFEEYHLFAMSDVPYCFDYHYNIKQPNTDSLLVFGVDTGAIHLLTFHKPITQLFQNPFKSEGGVQKIFMQDLPGHTQWVSHTVLPDIHPEIIRQVRYLPENQAIISASGCPKNTVVISDIVGVRKPYVFRIEKGVECFDHNKNLNLLVTGSGDHLVRLWNPYVTNKAVAILSGHATGVIGVAIHEGFRQVFSYSKDAVIKVWDIHEQTCLQTIMLKFPSSLHGRMPEHGQFPVYLQGSPHSALVVTCNDYVGALRLGKVEHNTSLMELTHDTQLCGAIYNKFFKQVATGCDSSTIAVWDIETGNKSIMFSNAHGEEEITAMAFDQNYRRLISGARNGTVKVWNFQNGHNLHKLEAVGEAEVTGIHFLAEKRVILTVGWSQKITLYDDSDADNMYIPANKNWKGGQRHKEDILSADYCHPNFLATASFDGEIIVWDVESEKAYVTLRKGQTPNVSKKLEALKTQINNNTESRPPSRPGSQNSRPNSRHRSSHRVAKGQPTPVDKLMFLKARMSIRFTESAVLISSEAGTLRWWSIYGAHKEIGNFYAPGIGDESVLAMTTKPNDSLLITGDTQGMIRCWDILDYCTRKDERTCRSPPPLETVWKAHDSAIVSVEYIVHDAGCFVLTASTDKTARLWSPEGHFVGTFGQKASWLLKNPSSWSHPDTPWTKEEQREAAERGEETKTEPEMEDGLGDIIIQDTEQEKDLMTGGIGRESSLPIGGDNDIHITAPTPTLDSRQTTSLSLPVSRQRNQAEVAMESRPTSVVIAATPSSASRDPVLNYRLRYRSQTYAYGFHRVERAKTFLGIKVEKDLERRQKDRKGRRVQYGEISAGRTSRFGKQCSPFHALSTPDWSEIQLPNNLPLSSRMISRGYTSCNLTTETINAMDFSYGGSDSPPGTTSREGRSASASRGATEKIVPPSREEKRVRLPPIKSGGIKKSPTSLS